MFLVASLFVVFHRSRFWCDSLFADIFYSKIYIYTYNRIVTIRLMSQFNWMKDEKYGKETEKLNRICQFQGKRGMKHERKIASSLRTLPFANRRELTSVGLCCCRLERREETNRISHLTNVHQLIFHMFAIFSIRINNKMNRTFPVNIYFHRSFIRFHSEHQFFSFTILHSCCLKFQRVQKIFVFAIYDNQ